MGWVGTPDPAKYRPDTQFLTPKQVEEEVKKGNVMLWKVRGRGGRGRGGCSGQRSSREGGCSGR